MSRTNVAVKKKIRLLLKRLGQLPGLHILIMRLWNTYECIKFIFYTQLNLNLNEWEATVDPYCVYWVQPNQIKKIHNIPFNFINDTGKIIGGRWDKNSKPIDNEPLYRFFEEVFRHNRHWKQTNYYKRKTQKISDGKEKRYSSISEFNNKMEFYQNLYKEFKRGEYKLQSNINSKNRKNSLGEGGRAFFPSLTDHTLIRHEIAISIGRDGTLLRNDGRHRLALAVIAGLDKVPVRVVVRHSEWQNHRVEVARLIKRGIKNGISAEDIEKYVEKEYQKELEGISMGLQHPDLRIIFDQYF